MGDGTSIFSGLKKVKTDNEDFNNKFSIRSENEYEAISLLTPSLMDKLLEIEEQINGTVGFAFIGNEIHIALYTHEDDFDISWLDKYDETTVEQNRKAIQRITNVFDCLYENQFLYY